MLAARETPEQINCFRYSGSERLSERGSAMRQSDDAPVARRRSDLGYQTGCFANSGEKRRSFTNFARSPDATIFVQ